MNEGFVAYWLLTVALILFATGWQELVADRIPGRILAALLAGILLLHSVIVPLGPYGSVHGSAIVATGAAVWAAAVIRRPVQMLFLLTSAFLTGFIWFWFRLTYASDPVFVLFRPEWDGPLMAGAMSGLLADRLRLQFPLVLLAAVAGQCADLFRPGDHGQSLIELGSLRWWDGLAVALAATRLTGMTKERVRRFCMRWASGSPEERGG